MAAMPRATRGRAVRGEVAPAGRFSATIRFHCSRPPGGADRVLGAKVIRRKSGDRKKGSRPVRCPAKGFEHSTSPLLK